MEECKECGVIEPVAASTEKMSAREYWIAYWNDHKEEQWRLNLNEAVWHFAEAYAAYCGAALPVAGQELKLTVAIPCPCCKFPECGHKHEMTGALQKAHEEYYAAQDMKRELSALREKLAHANEELRLEEQSHDAEMKRLAMELNGGETVETEELVKAIRKLREKLARALKAFEKIVELDENHLHTEGNMALGNARVVAEAAVADLKGDGNAS
jgi:DNA repair exonuclease SbcCD ATPase subunit